MSPNQGTVNETPAERSLSQIAMSRLQDYRTRWAPLQQRLATTITKMGAPGSIERERTSGRAVAEEGEQYSKGTAGLAKQSMTTGAGPSSGSFRTSVATLPAEGKSAAGSAVASGESMIDRAYVSGLQTLMSLGRGEKANATMGTAQAAGIQAQQAWGDAYKSLSDRSMWAGLGGTGAGMLAGAYMDSARPQPVTNPGAPEGYVPQMQPGLSVAPYSSGYVPPGYGMGGNYAYPSLQAPYPAHY